MNYQSSSPQYSKVISKVKVFKEVDRMTDRTKTTNLTCFLKKIKKSAKEANISFEKAKHYSEDNHVL